jgi:ketosteroid isomerase-like protein
MSQENVEVVHRAVDAVARQDVSCLIELTEPDIEWHSFLAQLAEGGAYLGHDGMRRYVEDLGDAWEFLRTQIDQVIHLGDWVLAVGRLRSRGKGSGVETETTVGYMVKLRNGRVRYMRAFRDPEHAFESVGLRE